MSIEQQPNSEPKYVEKASIFSGREGRSEFVAGDEAINQEERLQELKERTAEIILEYSLDIKSGDKLLIQMGDNGWQMASMIASRAKAAGAHVMIRRQDIKYAPDTRRTVVEAVSEFQKGTVGARFRFSGPDKQRVFSSREQMVATYLRENVVADDVADYRWADKIISVRMSTTDNEYLDAENVYRQAIKAANPERDVKIPVLIYTPTEEEALAAGMSYLDYAEVYYRACDRDWVEVGKTQEKLVELINQYETFTIRTAAPNNLSTGMDPAKWSCEVTMSISGMEGSSAIGKGNMPGSEVFWAPVRGTVEGQYALPYKVRMGKRVLNNIGFKFEKGKVVDFWMHNPNPGDEEYVREYLSTPGANEIGELGLGTNPLVDKPYLNTLLVEKNWVHMALGDSYPDKIDKKTNQVLIKRFNGVETKEGKHTDLTRCLLPDWGGGELILGRTNEQGNYEEKVLNKNGQYLDDEFAIFNDKNAFYKGKTRAE